MVFRAHRSDVDALDAARGIPAVARLLWFNHHFAKAEVVDGRLVLSDLRMGAEPDYTFRFAVAARDGDGWRAIPPEDPDWRHTRRMLGLMWRRIWRQPESHAAMNQPGRDRTDPPLPINDYFRLASDRGDRCMDFIRSGGLRLLAGQRPRLHRLEVVLEHEVRHLPAHARTGVTAAAEMDAGVHARGGRFFHCLGQRIEVPGHELGGQRCHRRGQGDHRRGHAAGERHVVGAEETSDASAPAPAPVGRAQG